MEQKQGPSKPPRPTVKNVKPKNPKNTMVTRGKKKKAPVQITEEQLSSITKDLNVAPTRKIKPKKLIPPKEKNFTYKLQREQNQKSSKACRLVRKYNLTRMTLEVKEMKESQELFQKTFGVKFVKCEECGEIYVAELDG